MSEPLWNVSGLITHMAGFELGETAAERFDLLWTVSRAWPIQIDRY